MSREGWDESTEGDLDPDLTEEAGYSGWDPPQRRWWPILMRAVLVVLIALLLVGLIGGVVLRFV